MSTVEVLKAAKALIEDESRWTQGQYARTLWGWPVDPTSAWAYRRCAWGALVCVDNRQDHADFLDLAAVGLFAMTPTTVNDFLGRWAVMRMYDRAIELAMADERRKTESSDRELVHA